jgi:class 3 adenylate cyclase
MLGTVYCGEAGSSKRCEYTAVGLKVNLAARMMQNADAAHTNAGILCDADTRELCGSEVTFEVLPPIPLKGIKEYEQQQLRRVSQIQLRA